MKEFFWSLPQPVYVLACALLTATAASNEWMDSATLVTIFIWLPIPLILIAERFMPKRKEWLLDWRDLTIDAFYVLSATYIWYPILDENYDTPISNLFTSIRDASGFPIRLEAESTLGILFAAIVALIAAELIGYWAHRVQHRFLFFWRIHATHHHLTKMSAARANRGHPLELLGLYLGSAIALAFLGASDEVVGVFVVISASTGYICHANLPLRSGLFGWLFNTPEWHQLHHSLDYDESNTNYGCVIIIWDRIFGTFSDKKTIERVGNGTGRRLSLIEQYLLPFRSNKTIRGL
jgi:sterol desaturase/sphingolipid hydroxylase (fatty acid hydroxylase superfamily)